VLTLQSDIQRTINSKLGDILPTMFETLGSLRFVPSEFELEMVAHGDDAHFTRHIDTFNRNAGSRKNRIISAVYYFHALPKSFSVGALRLHSLAASGEVGTYVDIEPDYDTLVFFPSWFPHEVLPVRCASGEFGDSRFAINCWVHRM
jgi:SM-20-related protein